MSLRMLSQTYLAVMSLVVLFAEGCEMECVMVKIDLRSSEGRYGRSLPVLTSQTMLWSPERKVCHAKVGDLCLMLSSSGECLCALSMLA